MKGHGNRIFGGMCAVASDLAVLCLAAMSLTVAFQESGAVMCFAWSGVLLLQLLVNEGMISLGAPVNLYLVWNGAAVAAQAWLAGTVFAASYQALDLAFLFGIFAAGIAVHGGVCSYFSHGPNGLLRYVDVLIVEIAFYLYTVCWMGVPADGELLVFSLLVLCADLMMVSRLRTGNGGSHVIRGSGIDPGIAAAVAVIGCLFAAGAAAGIASGQIHSMVDLLLAVLAFVWRIVSAVCSVIGRVLAFLILLLAMLFPATPERVRENAALTIQNTAEEVLETTDVMIPAWLIPVVAAAGAAALIIHIFYRLRGVRFARRKPRKKTKYLRKKNHVLEALSALAFRLKERLNFAYLCRRYRRTPEGLFAFAQRMGRSVKMGRKAAESPGGYMRRLAGTWEENGKERVEEPEPGKLRDLACLLDQIYYAGQSVTLADGQYREYAAAISKTGEQIKEYRRLHSCLTFPGNHDTLNEKKGAEKHG